MKVKTLVVIALLAGLVFVAKESLAFLPNIELVSFLFIVITLTLGVRKSVLTAWIFAALEVIVYGLGVWTIMYLWLWPLLCLLCGWFKKWLTDEHRLALFSGLFGLSFGLLYELPYFVIDFRLGLAAYLQGLPFDLLHAISNYIVMLMLYQPVYPKLRRVILRGMSDRNG